MLKIIKSGKKSETFENESYFEARNTNRIGSFCKVDQLSIFLFLMDQFQNLKFIIILSYHVKWRKMTILMNFAPKFVTMLKFKLCDRFCRLIFWSLYFTYLNNHNRSWLNQDYCVEYWPADKLRHKYDKIYHDTFFLILSYYSGDRTLKFATEFFWNKYNYSLFNLSE